MTSSSDSRPPIILASGSPRRRELLAGLGVDFRVIPPTVDEKTIDTDGLSMDGRVCRLAEVKGASIADQYPDALVIGADTTVVLDTQILEKPEDEADAARMLGLLQGRTHTVYSAIAVFYQGRRLVRAAQTTVQMRALSPPEIQAYIATGEPMDKAGAYAIQGVGSVLIERIDGCYFNVVGMSMVLLDSLCRELGVTLALSQTEARQQVR